MMTQTILLIDDVATNRIVTRVKLAAAHYNVVCATSGTEGLDIAAREHPALVMAATNLSDMAPDVLCKRLRMLPGLSDAGIVMIAGDLAFSHADALAAGADEVLRRPLDDVTLMPLVRSLVRRQRKSSDLANRIARLGMVPEAPGAFAFAEMAQLSDASGLIAIVSPQSTRAVQLKAMMAGNLRDRLVVLSPDQAVEAIETSPPDMLILDVGTLDIRAAISCIADYRHRVSALNTALVVMTALNDPETAAVARDLGAADAIPFGITADELCARLRTQLMRKRANDAQRDRIDEGLRLAAIDPLTGLLNRRAGLLALERLMVLSRERLQSLALLAIDVDNFKGVNDLHGHASGDAVLAALAERISPTLRANDLFVRIGGDEFIIALPGSHIATARLVAERIRQLVERMDFALPDGSSLCRTVSIGIAMSEPEDRLDPTSLVAMADQAMYVAKTAGRNSVAGRSAA